LAKIGYKMKMKVELGVSGSHNVFESDAENSGACFGKGRVYSFERLIIHKKPFI